MPSLGIVAQDKVVDPAAIHLAKMADAVVLSVGFSPATESEGRDRTYQLPFGQEELIREVTAANPKTVVVLTAGGSVATQDWIDRTPALLQTWYGGQEAGTALVKLLLGDVNPSGKLPISWEKQIEDNPTYKTYYEPPGTRDIKYSEGVFVGYRYYETSRGEAAVSFWIRPVVHKFRVQQSFRVAADDLAEWADHGWVRR